MNASILLKAWRAIVILAAPARLLPRLGWARATFALRAVMLVAAWLSPAGASAWQARGQTQVDSQSAVTISGRVTDEAGKPLKDAIVEVEGLRLYTQPDSAGRFRLTGVPPGRHQINAKSIGYHEAILPVQFARGEQVELDFVLEEATIPFAGMEAPLPPEDKRKAAATLLSQVLRDSVVTMLLQRHLSPEQRRDTLIVWTEWLPNGQGFVLGGHPVLRAVVDCPTCVSETFVNIFEGAHFYVAGVTHINVGLSDEPPRRGRLRFCINVVKPRDTLHRNCGSSYALELIEYVQGTDGAWHRLKDGSQ